MDLIERAAQRLGQVEDLAKARHEVRPRLVEAVASPPAPASPIAVRDEGERDPPKTPVRLRKTRPAKFATIDDEHLADFSEILVPNGYRYQTAETFRHIKRRAINYEILGGAELANVLMVTSAKQGEGKTHVAINLALSVARERDLKAVIVDADLARSDVTKRLGIKADVGLYDYLDDSAMELSDILIETSIEGLSVVPAGSKNEKSTELLASQRMKWFVKEIALDSPNSVIIFDSPPLLATTESAVLTENVGRVLFIVEYGKTTRNEIQRALDLISEETDTGLVLNKQRVQVGIPGYYNY